MSLVEIKDIHRSYTTGAEVTRVLYGLDLEMGKGEMVMVMGPSGSGKTTLLNIMGGIDRADSGTVMISGLELGGLGKSGLNTYRRRKVGFIFQFYNLIPTLTSRENVELGLETTMKDRNAIRDRAVKYLEHVGLSHKLNSFPQELSGGEQQRVAVARALAKEPDIILADEPTGNLDEDRGARIMKLMNRLRHEEGISFLIVSHNPGLKSYMDRILVLRKGKLHPES